MTAVSDLEVIQKECVGKMYYYRYPIEGEEGQYIHIATTRPETMFGDTAVAVSKDNEKLKHLIGKNCIIPIINRAIPIIADEHGAQQVCSGPLSGSKGTCNSCLCFFIKKKKYGFKATTTRKTTIKTIVKQQYKQLWQRFFLMLL